MEDQLKRKVSRTLSEPVTEPHIISVQLSKILSDMGEEMGT